MTPATHPNDSARLARTAASEPRRCPVCDRSADVERLFDNRMAPIAGIDFGYDVVACDACGMVYASRSPDDATLERYYRDLSKYDHPRSRDELNAVDVDRAETAAAFTRRLVPAGSRVLDVGCSIGLYVAALARSGSHDARGLDPSSQAADVARSLFGAVVDVGDAHAFDGYGAFDAIALLAVLEHLRDPARLLRTLARQMKPGAFLIVEVPNADYFGTHPDVGRASEPFGEFSNEHINFFGDASLREIAANVGLSWVASEEFPYLIGIRGLLAAFRKGDGPAMPGDTGASRRSVRRYVEHSAAALEVVEARLAAARLSDRSIVLYGAGSHTARLLAQGSLGDASIEAVLDRNPHLEGCTIGGLPILPPGALARMPGCPVVVSSFYAMASIADYVRANFGNEVVTLYGPATRRAPEAAPAGRAHSSLFVE